MRHRIAIVVAALLFTALASAGRLGAEENAAPAPSTAPLLSTGTTILGETLHYPTNGPAHVTAAIVTLPPGGRTVLHKHGVPMFGYILEGEIMEAMDAAHFGADAGPQPVRICHGSAGRRVSARCSSVPAQAHERRHRLRHTYFWSRSKSSIEMPCGPRKKQMRRPGRMVRGSMVNSTPLASSSAATASMPLTVSPKWSSPW